MNTTSNICDFNLKGKNAVLFFNSFNHTSCRRVDAYSYDIICSSKELLVLCFSFFSDIRYDSFLYLFNTISTQNILKCIFIINSMMRSCFIKNHITWNDNIYYEPLIRCIVVSVYPCMFIVR
jgi:hypothetical protein